MRRVFVVALSLLLGVAVRLGISSPVIAASFDASVTSTYEIAKDSKTKVVHNLSLTNTADTTVKELTFNKPGSDVSGVKATVGGAEATSRFDEGSGIIIVQIPGDKIGKDKKWSLDLHYETSAVKALGSASAVQIPRLSVSELNITKHTVNVNADVSLGFAIVRGPEPKSSRVGIGKQNYVFENETSSFDKTVTLFFGDATVVEATYKTTLKNDGWWPQTKVLTLPPDTNQQQVFLNNVEPKPKNLRLDADGNIIAEYLVWPKKQVEVTASALVAVRNLTYSLDKAKDKSEPDANLSERYGNTTGVWKAGTVEADANLKQTELIKALLDGVSAKVKAEDIGGDFDAANRRGAVQYADMLVGELRAHQIPSRVVLGKVTTDGQALVEEGKPHAWVEAFISGVGWVTLDPTLESISDYYGTADILHVGLALWGVKDDFPPIDLAAASIKYSADKLPEAKQEVIVNTTKYVILPGISVLSTTVSLPAGFIVDNAALRLGGDSKIVPLGSLAPLQDAKSRTVRLLGAAFSKETVAYGLLSDGMEIQEPSAQGDTNLSFVPLIVLVGSGVVLIGAYVLWRRRHNRRLGKQRREGDDAAPEDAETEEPTVQEDEPVDPIEKLGLDHAEFEVDGLTDENDGTIDSSVEEVPLPQPAPEEQRKRPRPPRLIQ